MSKSKILSSIYFGLIALVLTSYLVFSTITGKQLVIQSIPSVNSEPKSSNSKTSGIIPSSVSGNQPPTSVSNNQSISDTTTNWAGYAATNGTYTGVSGTWTVPNASGSDETSADATWIGIGGVNSNDLIQVGTQNVVAPSGQVSSSAFFEMLPDSSENIDNVSVNPGDSITASLKEVSSGDWTINFTDNTNGETYTNNVQYDSTLSSVEWIEEDPSDGVNEIPFDNFGTATFTDGKAIDNGNNVSISGSGAQALTMINSDGQSLASTSSLVSNGEGFSVTRTSASSGPGIQQYNNNPWSWSWQGNGIGDPYSSQSPNSDSQSPSTTSPYSSQDPNSFGSGWSVFNL